MSNTNWSFESGTTDYKGCRVDRVLRASTKHMPDLTETLASWHWGTWNPYSVVNPCDWEMAWIYAYEDNNDPVNPIPDWLFNLCIKAREVYGCNWILLDPDGDVVEGLPVYDHP